MILGWMDSLGRDPTSCLVADTSANSDEQNKVTCISVQCHGITPDGHLILRWESQRCGDISFDMTTGVHGTTADDMAKIGEALARSNDMEMRMVCVRLEVGEYVEQR